MQTKLWRTIDNSCQKPPRYDKYSNIKGLILHYEPLFVEELTFALYILARTPAVIPAKTAIGRNNTMTRHVGSKGITPESLTNGLSTTTAYASRQISVCDGLAWVGIE